MRNRTTNYELIAKVDTQGVLTVIEESVIPTEKIKVVNPKVVTDSTYYKSIAQVVEERVARIKEAERVNLELKKKIALYNSKLMANCWDNVEKMFNLQ